MALTLQLLPEWGPTRITGEFVNLSSVWVSNIQQTCILRPAMGLCYKKEVFLQMLQRQKTFQMERLCSWELISATSFPARAKTNFYVIDPQSPGNSWEAPNQNNIHCLVHSVTSPYGGMSALQKSPTRGPRGEKFTLCQLSMSRHVPPGLRMNK